MDGHAPEGELRFQILGPARIWRDDVELDTGPPQQTALLTLLLAREGGPVTTGRLVDLLWGDGAPASAVNIVHKYVSALRHLLEPGLPPRAQGTYLLRRESSYLFRVGPAELDAVTFRRLVAEARARPAEALDHLSRALALWQGRVGESARSETAVRGLTALDAEFLDTCVQAARLATRLGRPESVLPALHLAARIAPLNEAVQAGLIQLLATADRPAQAVAVFAATRERLAGDLGVQPGTALTRARRQVLHRTGDGPDGSGRRPELDLLRRTFTTPRPSATVVVVEGEPGIGKTHLLDAACAQAARLGLLVARGRAPENDPMPPMWPWTTAFREIEPGFEHLDQAVDLLERSDRPVLLVIDDLQWADPQTLRQLRHLAVRSPARTVILAALRDRAPLPAPDLVRTLTALSRVPGQRRLTLGPLDPDRIADLVHQETGRVVERAALRRLTQRAGGNPFLARELAHTRGEGVPVAVRDVVRQRMTSLTPDERSLLQVAALIGRDVDPDLLTRTVRTATGGSSARPGRESPAEVQLTLERLEPAVGLGLLDPAHDGITGADGADGFRFTHELLREAVGATVGPARAALLSRRIAELTRPGALRAISTTVRRSPVRAGHLGA
ncbi:BTAD domain-containing putative transcriptional regulator [Kineosporia succinea]|uniref:DNA-binding SARP family transcriptional activator n=1 Tax=Kineosporia succinea TaxID=84632 RepID=A0ABT9PEL2_9ACTN|nr:BTAD domain-containing putative transcriptional regulator [Kineosporia succinea]MDP9830941.1 DNA-binding SARP family transcriptional activator [Kineosporia succinea]